MIRNGYFQLEVKKDGTYITIYPPLEGGNYCDAAEICKYLDNRKVDYDKRLLYDVCKPSAEPQNVRLTTLILGGIDETGSIEINSDCTVATVRFYPEMPGCKKMEHDDVLFLLNRRGIKFGIDEAEIGRFLKERYYCTPYVLAKAEPPVEGTDASIEYRFSTDLSKKPKMNEDGTVDFHQLDNLSGVEAGQVLAVLTPAVQGTPGTDVLGRPIKPRKVNFKFLKQSKNTHISPDGCQLISNVSGHAVLTGGEIFVSDIYQIPANVDASTGDINYDGNVEISGNVNTGYRVQASGDIIVSGIVEGAELIAGGQIVLKRGIQGMSRGMLRAGSNIIAKFIESADVSAGGYIQTESIMHSRVYAGGEIVVRGRKGFITGGSIKSGRYIEAKTAGSVMGTQTIIEVGENIALAEEMRALTKERQKLSADIESAGKIISFITKKIKDGEKVAQDKLQQFQKLTAAVQMYQKRIAEIDDRMDRIGEMLGKYSNGYILVDDVIFPGCRVTISNVTTFIHSETKHCRLMRDGADIRVKAY